MTEIRTERGDLVPEKWERWFTAKLALGFDRRVLLACISDLAHAEAKYAAAEQAWQKDAADKNKLVEMLTERVRELEQPLAGYVAFQPLQTLTYTPPPYLVIHVHIDRDHNAKEQP